MNHAFDVEHAKEYGIVEAILLNNFSFWISKNRANGDNYFDGRYWTYNSMAAFCELFPYMSAKTIRNALQHLIDAGILQKGNFNENPLDRTLWYAFTDFGDCLIRANAFAQKGKSTLYNKTDINLQIRDKLISEDISSSASDFERVISAWNGLGLNQVKSISEGTQRYQMLMKRIRDYGIEEVLRTIESVKDSSFLMGKEKQWKATFDWVICPNNFIKVRDGNYLDAPKKVYSEEETPYKAARKLSREIRKRLPNIPEHDEATIQRWASELEECCKEYNSSFDDMAEVMKLSQEDPFWRDIILDAPALRRNYLKILSKVSGGEQT